MATPNGDTQNGNFWQTALGRYEPGQYYGSLAGKQFGAGSPRRKRYFMESYDDIMKDFYSQAGEQMRAGEAPTSWMDFLETNPWSERYTSLPQSARNVTGMASNPRTRFLFNY
mgnify:FL=1